MARARNIKPGFFRNAELVELSYEARLLFIGLWTIADRDGRLEDRPKQIKMELFPADSLDCDAILKSLEEIGMIARYEIGGKRYLQVINFLKHQNPHKDERASTIPAINEHCASTVQTPCKDDATSEVVGLIPDSLLLNPESIPHSPQTGASDVEQKKKSSPIALQTYLDRCKAENQKPIPENDPVFDYTDKVGIPEEWLRLHWTVFKKRHTESSSKRQRDWCQKFRNSVEGNWYKIWYIGANGVCKLSSTGQQAQLAHQEQAVA